MEQGRVLHPGHVFRKHGGQAQVARKTGQRVVELDFKVLHPTQRGRRRRGREIHLQPRGLLHITERDVLWIARIDVGREIRPQLPTVLAGKDLEGVIVAAQNVGAHAVVQKAARRNGFGKHPAGGVVAEQLQHRSGLEVQHLGEFEFGIGQGGEGHPDVLHLMCTGLVHQAYDPLCLTGAVLAGAQHGGQAKVGVHPIIRGAEGAVGFHTGFLEGLLGVGEGGDVQGGGHVDLVTQLGVALGHQAYHKAVMGAVVHAAVVFDRPAAVVVPHQGAACSVRDFSIGRTQGHFLQAREVAGVLRQVFQALRTRRDAPTVGHIQGEGVGQKRRTKLPREMRDIVQVAVAEVEAHFKVGTARELFQAVVHQPHVVGMGHLQRKTARVAQGAVGFKTHSEFGHFHKGGFVFEFELIGDAEGAMDFHRVARRHGRARTKGRLEGIGQVKPVFKQAAHIGDDRCAQPLSDRCTKCWGEGDFKPHLRLQQVPGGHGGMGQHQFGAGDAGHVVDRGGDGHFHQVVHIGTVGGTVGLGIGQGDGGGHAGIGVPERKAVQFREPLQLNAAAVAAIGHRFEGRAAIKLGGVGIGVAIAAGQVCRIVNASRAVARAIQGKVHAHFQRIVQRCGAGPAEVHLDHHHARGRLGEGGGQVAAQVGRIRGARLRDESRRHFQRQAIDRVGTQRAFDAEVLQNAKGERVALEHVGGRHNGLVHQSVLEVGPVALGKHAGFGLATGVGEVGLPVEFSVEGDLIHVRAIRITGVGVAVIPIHHHRHTRGGRKLVQGHLVDGVGVGDVGIDDGGGQRVGGAVDLYAGDHKVFPGVFGGVDVAVVGPSESKRQANVVRRGGSRVKFCGGVLEQEGGLPRDFTPEWICCAGGLQHHVGFARGRVGVGRAGGGLAEVGAAEPLGLVEDGFGLAIDHLFGQSQDEVFFGIEGSSRKIGRGQLDVAVLQGPGAGSGHRYKVVGKVKRNAHFLYRIVARVAQGQRAGVGLAWKRFYRGVVHIHDQHRRREEIEAQRLRALGRQIRGELARCLYQRTGRQGLLARNRHGVAELQIGAVDQKDRAGEGHLVARLGADKHRTRNHVFQHHAFWKGEGDGEVLGQFTKLVGDAHGVHRGVGARGHIGKVHGFDQKALGASGEHQRQKGQCARGGFEGMIKHRVKHRCGFIGRVSAPIEKPCRTFPRPVQRAQECRIFTRT